MTFQLIRVTSDEQLKLAFHIRRVVYIEEQDVPEDLEFDGLDDIAENYLVMCGDDPIATFRIIYKDDFAKLERFAVLKSWRGKGVGVLMVEESIERSREMGYKVAQLDAQIRAIDFYKKFGFEVVSEEFMDAGIPHKKMSLNLRDKEE
jgi:predicted GNAT family N-acyltransferase